MFFRDLSVEFAVAGHSEPTIRWREHAGAPTQTAHGPLEIYQDSSGGDNWKSNNHVNRHGEIPLSFRGYRVRVASQERYGLRATPVVRLGCPRSCLTVAVDEFWQQFPKAIEAAGRRLCVRLFPGQAGDLYELQGGEQKTHTVWLDMSANAESTEPLSLGWVAQPARVQAQALCYAHSGALPYLTPPSNEGCDQLEGLLREAVIGERSLTARRETIDEYGWRNYGDIYADHEAAHYPGPPPVVSHYNNQYDCLFGTLLQFLRTGDWRWFDLAGPLARHVIDIDIYHTKEDRAAYNGGLFWPTDHYKDAATATHRTYSRFNCRPGDGSYGGGPSNEHNYTTGLLLYYFLTADPQARSAVLKLARWILDMDDGRKNILGLVDSGPTGLASCTREPHYHGPGRGCGNSVNALLDAWLLTNQLCYLNKAEELIRRSIHPADDVAKNELLDVERRWSYTVFLSVLARYIQLRAEAGQIDFMYAYARASLLHCARWMLANETPYFDRPEQLEYPTETWAAQELRKANVLRLAAVYASEPLRSDLTRRGDELAQRAWHDLDRFPSRTVARALALLMTEGVRDAYFQKHVLPDAPVPLEEYDFGRPSCFVSQRARILAQLRTARGCASLALRLADPRRWLALCFPARTRD
jgi:hypothetical protein